MRKVPGRGSILAPGVFPRVLPVVIGLEHANNLTLCAMRKIGFFVLTSYRHRGEFTKGNISPLKVTYMITKRDT